MLLPFATNEIIRERPSGKKNSASLSWRGRPESEGNPVAQSIQLPRGMKGEGGARGENENKDGKATDAAPIVFPIHRGATHSSRK